MDRAFSKEQLKKELLNENVSFYLTYKDENLVGYCKLNEKEAQTEPFGNTSLEIERIYVLNEFQGQQFGKQMLLKIIETAKGKNLEFIWLGVWEKNTAAIRFYERHGFVKIGTHPYYIGNDKQTDWLMRLDLV
jgi:ribosomal protein S18 acetylase RimI-like enzyme